MLRRILVAVLLLLCGVADCLRILGIAVPSLADLRQPVTLTCSYDMEQDIMYSVKWYKDDHEFYRYLPLNSPNVMSFPFEGARLELSPTQNLEPCSLSQCTVRLEQLSPAASGAYTCEVSTDAPTFGTAFETRNMTVAAFPLEEPRIEGLRAAYTIGDLLDITCKSAPSAPPAQLKLYVNNEEVEQQEMTRMEVPVNDDLSSSLARLRMVLSKGHFKNGGSSGAVLRVVCSAALAAVPAPARSSAAMAILADAQTLHNQKLEWPNASDKTSASILFLAIVTCAQIFNILI